MSTISINLLPIEFREQQLKRAKFYKVQLAGVAVILLMVFLSSLTIALRILQSQNILQLQKRVNASQQIVSGLKSTQGSLLLLKNRLTTIDQYLGSPSRQSQMYKLIAQLLPSSVTVTSISVDSGGNVLISAIMKDSNSLEDLINNLISKEKNQDKINQVSLETLSRGKDGVYRLNFKVTPK